MAKPKKTQLDKAKETMAAMLGMKPKHHEDMKLGKRTAKKVASKSDGKRQKRT